MLCFGQLGCYFIISDSATPRTVAHQAPRSVGFSRQEPWSGLSFPSPGDLPDPWVESISCFGRYRPVGSPCQLYRKRLYSCYCFPGGPAGKESSCNVGDLGSIVALGRSPRGGQGYPLQYSGLEHSTHCIIHGATKSRTRLRDVHFQVLLRAFHYSRASAWF